MLDARLRRRPPAATLPAWVCLTLVASGGCAGHRGGVLRDLPDPVFAHIPTPPPGPVARPSPPPSLRPRVSTQAAWWPAGGISPRWECIVIHHSATSSGCAERFDRDHRGRGWDGLGYHFVIGNGSDTPNGRVEVGARWVSQKHGAHTKTPDGYYNQHGIGICLVGNFEQTRPTRAQMESLVGLVRFLMDQCDIGSDRIRTHGGITGKTLCPGRNLSVADVKRGLTGVPARTASHRP